jgi:hypothetical protein
MPYQTRIVDGRVVRRRSMEIYDDTSDRLAALADVKGVPVFGMLDAIVNAACDAYEREFGPLNVVSRRQPRVNSDGMLAAMDAIPPRRRPGRKKKNPDQSAADNDNN